ncbi:MAG TPA: hypothetical protein VI636_05410 [Candidatus Angelobacter sp.]
MAFAHGADVVALKVQHFLIGENSSCCAWLPVKFNEVALLDFLLKTLPDFS